MIRDLDLPRHGLRIVERPLSNFLPLPDGRYLKVGPGRTQAEVAKFSVRDAERLDAYEARLGRLADVLRAIALETPPNVATGRGVGASLGALLATARVANRLRPLGLEGQRDLLEIFTRSAGDVLDQWFESDPIKAILGFDGIVGTYASPYAAGTAYVLLHHCFGEVNGTQGRLGPCDRRHGRDHAGDGARLRRARRRDPHGCGRRGNRGRATAAPPASSPRTANGSPRARSSRACIRS